MEEFLKKIFIKLNGFLMAHQVKGMGTRIIRNTIAKHFSLRLQDWSTKTDITGALKFLRKSQYWGEDEIRDYQSQKLKLLVAHSYKNIPYYNELFKKVKLKPTDIQSIDDITKIPILTKEMVQSQGHKLLNPHHNLKNIKVGKTGGTTGVPLKFYKDTQNRSFTWASYYRWYEWMGINYFDRQVTFWGQGRLVEPNPKKNLKQDAINFVQNKKIINSFKLSQSEMPRIYEEVMNFGPALIKGYLSALIDFADYIDTHNLP
ncbi:MAG: phenylacetate-CoA ligase, partial [Parvicella sp.]